jgi:RHS repeat-associated protein
VYDDNNKLTSASGGGQSASFGYDGNGNMTSITGALYPNKTMVYNDENRMTSISYGAVTDTYTYNANGQRTRAYLNGTYYRYLYNGERVLLDLEDDGDMLHRYTTEDGSYSGSLLMLKQSLGEHRYPLYDNIGSVRGLVSCLGTLTDTYDMDTFGTDLGSTETTVNPYRYGGAWGYITDPSGLLQLGARFYWPEVGRFVNLDPARDEVNWYAYVGDRPTVAIDPTGKFWLFPWTWFHHWGHKKDTNWDPINGLANTTGKDIAKKIAELMGDKRRIRDSITLFDSIATGYNLPAKTRQAYQQCSNGFLLASNSNQEDRFSVCYDCCTALADAAGMKTGDAHLACQSEKGCGRYDQY